MKEKKSNSKKYLLMVILFFSFFVVLGIGLLIYKTATRFHYEEHLEDALITVDNEIMTLKDFGYYILLMERDTQETAFTYDADHPVNYWNLYIGKTETELNYVRNIAKDYAIDYCIRDLVYFQSMKADRASFSEEEQVSIEKKAREAIEGFSSEQLQAVGMTGEELYQVAFRVEQSHAYMEGLAAQGIDQDEMELNGKFYQELLSHKQIMIDEKLMNRVTFGSITVNNKKIPIKKEE